MLKAIRRFIDTLDEGSDHPGRIQRDDLHDAVAGLLHEMTRADLHERPEEKRAAIRAVAALFHLDEAAAVALVEDSAGRAQRFTSYFGPVALIKRHYGPAERIALIEHLWRIAYADGALDPYEDHYVRKIAHLLYVSNTDAMLARNRARPSAGT